MVSLGKDEHNHANANKGTVVGAEEASSRTLNIRNRDDQSTQNKGELVPVEKALEELVKLKQEKRLLNKF